MVIISLKYYILMLLSGIFGQVQPEPVCTRLHYEEMVLKRIGNLELMVEQIRGEVVNLELMVEEIRGEITLGREIRGKKSAFTVTHPVEGLDTNTLKFTNIITNIGQHYSMETGQFTCEYPGIYVYSLNIWKEKGASDVKCDIRQNNVQVVRAAVDPDCDGYFSGSTSAVIHMAYGDIADVYCETGLLSLHVHAINTYNSFSGVLIIAD